jgi:hypothetical protein
VAVQEYGKGFANETEKVPISLTFPVLKNIYDSTPGLVADKLKGVLENAWLQIKKIGKRGIVFAYDEAQNLADHAAKDQFPLSLLLDVFQSIQRKEVPFMLALTGLPTLFPKLIEARTYSERMFHVIFLDSLTEQETTDAIKKPLKDAAFQLTDPSVKTIWEITRGYPYFVQYVCKEVYDIWIQGTANGHEPTSIPVREIIRKLDTDFFDGRWARATDRQRDLLGIIAQLPNCDKEFTVQEIVEHKANKELDKPFSSSHVNQMLVSLSDAGLVYKNRHGKYAFAVPLLGEFIQRQ